MHDADVLIIGGGPVGLLASLLAAKKGLSVIILDSNIARDQDGSRANGITPPSLEIMREAGVDAAVISRGVKVVHSGAFGTKNCLGKVDFTGIQGDYRFILSIPQADAEKILGDAVASESRIKHLKGRKVCGVEEGPDVRVYGSGFSFSGKYALACDGAKSDMRRLLDVPFDGGQLAFTFLMGDFEDTTGWGETARLYFTRLGSVESFPLPGGRRRYVLRTKNLIKENTSDFIVRELPLRCPISLSGAKKYWESGFTTEQYMARSFCKGRVFLCGDAAHLMPPIGGQNMNTGFADAELAVWAVDNLIRGKIDPARAGRLYNRVRKSAAKSAARRARFMMMIGTTGGLFWSALRNFIVRILLLIAPLKNILIRMFCMQSIRYRNMSAYMRICLKELKA